MTIDRFRPAGAAAVLALLLAAGCTGEAPPQPLPAPSPTPTGWGPRLAEHQAYERIPLDGTDASPLYWRLPEIDDEETAAVLLAARRFMAVSHHVTSHPTDEEAYLYQWVATDREIAVYYPDGPPDPDRVHPRPTLGPAWVWVVEVDRFGPSAALVHTCEDTGWRGSAERAGELPDANRAFIWHYLVLKDDVDGARRWLVDQAWPDRDQLGPQVRADCEEWATHTPEEAR